MLELSIFRRIKHRKMSNTLSNLREFYQLTQEDLARILDSSKSQVAMFEQYSRKATSAYINKRFMILEKAMFSADQGVRLP